MKGLLDPGAVARPGAVEPGPLPEPEAAGGAVGLRVDRRGDAVADQDGQGEITEISFCRRHIGLEAVIMPEEIRQPRPLDDQRIEGREDVRGLRLPPGRIGGEGLGAGPVRLQPRDRDGHQPAGAHAGLDARGDVGLAAGLQVADRVEADGPLRPERAVEAIVEDLRRSRRARARRPAEMPVGELVGLHHAGPGRDGQQPGVEGVLQHALGRLAAGPEMGLLDRIVVDVADAERAVAADAGGNGADLGGADRAEPAVRRLPVRAHGRQVIAQVGDRQIGQRMAPVFEYGLLRSQRQGEVGADIIRDPGPEDVMVAALDHVDRVDLDIAESGDRTGDGTGSGAEGPLAIEALRPEPEAAGGGERKRMRTAGHRRISPPRAGGRK